MNNLLLLLLGSVTHIFYLPLVITSYLGAAEVRGAGVLAPIFRGFGRCVLDRKSGMPEWSEFGVWKMTYLMMRMHRKFQLNPLNFYYTFSIVHFKLAYE
jgi:hypothetical protein